MHQRRLGNTGLIVSEIGMGTWELGGREWGDIGETDAVDLLRYAFESGVTYYDTADQYGGGRSLNNCSVRLFRHSATGSSSLRNSAMSWTLTAGLVTDGNIHRSTSHPTISDPRLKEALSD